METATISLATPSNPFKVQFLEDNQAAIQVLKSGRSPALRHLDRTHRVSLAWLHDVFSKLPIELQYIASEKEAADIFTKAFVDKYKWTNAVHLINHFRRSELASGRPDPGL